jgi:A/G-specific adenine glycosylase
MHDFSKALEAWYLAEKRDLPWRRQKDPYSVWLSEIILQQTRVSQGVSYYHRFLDAFPTVHDLAQASEEAVLKLWQGLGYYSRARNLHHSARYISEVLKGVFPSNYQDLLKLKGVGDYTASAIASICFDEAVAVVDGNVYRVLSRYFGVETPINSSKGVREFKALAQQVMGKTNPGQYNQAIMEFGALQCKPQKPACGSCPVQIRCVAYQSRQVFNLPVKLKKNKVKKRYFNFIVLQTPDMKTRVELRKGQGIWKHLYQFPLIESNQTLQAEELIEHEEFLNLITDPKATLRLFNSKEWEHKLTHQHLYVRFWLVHARIRGAFLTPIASLEAFPVPRLIHKFLEVYDFQERD